MSTEANKALARRFIEEVWNKRNMAAIDDLMAPNHVDHPEQPPFDLDREASKQYTMGYLAAFPDMHFTIEDVVAEGDMVVTRWTGRGTHQGTMPGIAPTGKSVTVTGISISRIAGGQAVESWTTWDQLGFLQQLGVLPAPEQARQVGA